VHPLRSPVPWRGQWLASASCPRASRWASVALCHTHDICSPSLLAAIGHRSLCSAVDYRSLCSVSVPWLPQVLESALFYELPTVRANLLSSAWAWMKQLLPKADDAPGGSTRKCLRIVLQHDASGGGMGGRWSDVLGEVSSGKQLPLSSRSWGAIGRSCSLLSSMSGESFPSAELEWFLPNVVVLAQLTQAGLGDGAGKTEQRDALVATLALSSTLIRADPSKVRMQLWSSPRFDFASCAPRTQAGSRIQRSLFRGAGIECVGCWSVRDSTRVVPIPAWKGCQSS
jgi:hypothetical protein